MKYQTFKRPEPLPAPDLSGRRVVRVRVPYRYDVDAASLEAVTATPEPTRTQQQFKDEVDINTIAKNFGITGKLPQGVRMPTYADFCDVDDYQSALNAARWAQHSFMQMPANVRERFQNNPQAFVAFCSDQSNREEAIKLGLIVAPPVSAQTPPPPEAPKPI